MKTQEKYLKMEKTWQKTIDCFKGNIKKENIINNYL